MRIFELKCNSIPINVRFEILKIDSDLLSCRSVASAVSNLSLLVDSDSWQDNQPDLFIAFCATKSVYFGAGFCSKTTIIIKLSKLDKLCYGKCLENLKMSNKEIILIGLDRWNANTMHTFDDLIWMQFVIELERRWIGSFALKDLFLLNCYCE